MPRSFPLEPGGISSKRALVSLSMKIAAAILLVLLAAFCARLFGSHHHRDHQSRMLEAQLTGLAQRLSQFRQDSGALPMSLDELTVPGVDAQGPYIKPSSLSDPWGVPVFYRRLGERNEFIVFSLGEDGKLGGSGNAMDRQATYPPAAE